VWEQASPGLLGTWPLKQRYGGGRFEFYDNFCREIFETHGNNYSDAAYCAYAHVSSPLLLLAMN